MSQFFYQHSTMLNSMVELSPSKQKINNEESEKLPLLYILSISCGGANSRSGQRNLFSLTFTFEKVCAGWGHECDTMSCVHIIY